MKKVFIYLFIDTFIVIHTTYKQWYDYLRYLQSITTKVHMKSI